MSWMILKLLVNNLLIAGFSLAKKAPLLTLFLLGIDSFHKTGGIQAPLEQVSEVSLHQRFDFFLYFRGHFCAGCLVVVAALEVPHIF